MRTLLVIDVMNLAYRALHTTGKLAFGDNPTGVTYGIYKSLVSISEELRATDYAFCFDSHVPKRAEIYPQYKQKRKEKREEENEDEKLARQAMYKQVTRLWTLIQECGCTNVFGSRGYESDDLMADIALNLQEGVKAYLVSSDEDLYQCLRQDVVAMYKPTPKRVYEEADLMAEYGLVPGQVASAKAWAGCTSDNIIGLKGVGMKTAAKFILGKSSNVERFTDHLETYNHNIQLTRLPFPGTPRCKVQYGQGIDWGPLKREIGTYDAPVPGGFQL